MAIILGLLTGINRSFSLYISPSLNSLRIIPIALYIPIAMLLIGSDISLPIFLSSFITILYGYLPVNRATVDFDEEKIFLLEHRGYNKYKLVYNFVLPEILNSLNTSIKITITLSLAVTLLAEMLIQNIGGIGYAIISSKENSNYLEFWSIVITFSCIGLLFLKILLVSWKYSFPWINNSSREE